jgi:hypothetical protein
MKYKRRDPMGPFFVGKGRRGERERGREGERESLLPSTPFPTFPHGGRSGPSLSPLGETGKGVDGVREKS